MKDHFSGHAGTYAAFRPDYPAELFAWLATLPARRSQAWDCATGSGQAALALTETFPRVAASDGSAAQVAHARRHPRVHYFVSTAEQVPLAGGSVDLITVAQALHWFDHGRFYAEAARLLAPGGTIAVWCYNLLRIDPLLDPLIDRFYFDTVGPFWPPERAILEQGYRTLPFPFEEIAPPAFAMEAQWDLPHLLGYLESWSALQRCRRQTGQDPLPALAAELTPLWGEGARRVAWPLALRVGRMR